VDLLAEHVTNKPASADAKLDAPAARAAPEIQKQPDLPQNQLHLLNQFLNQPQNQRQNLPLNVRSALTNVKNVAERHVVLATDKPVNAPVNPVIPVVLAVTSVVKSALLVTKQAEKLSQKELLLPQ